MSQLTAVSGRGVDGVEILRCIGYVDMFLTLSDGLVLFDYIFDGPK